MDKQTLVIDGYRWVGLNRCNLHCKAPKGSGGVGLLIKNSLYTDYRIEIIDNTMDGILGVKFANKLTDYTFVIFSCYLPPEGSPWGRDASSFFTHLLTQIYLHYDADAMFVCGDFNARIGSAPDFDKDLDNVPPKLCVDSIQNQHGKSFIEFLIDCKFCVLNGRFNKESNDYTFRSTRGHSVVDYICVPHDVYKRCSDFRIISCNDIVENGGLVSLQDEHCKIPDHGFLIFDFITSEQEENTNSKVQDKQFNPNGTGKKFKLRCIPPSFMTSVNVRTSLLNLIRIIETCRESQENIDRTYSELCTIITSEMECNIPKFDWSKRSRKKFRTHKPYWNNELTELWRKMREKEKLYLKHKRNKNILKHRSFIDYKYAQKELDRRMRFFRRKYDYDLAISVEHFSSKNPKQFWEELKSLGPKRKNKIPVECYTDSGTVTNEPDYVKNAWKSEFSNLYNPPSTSTEFDIDFLQHAIESVNFAENNMLDPLRDHNAFLNRPLELSEIKDVIKKAKNGKSAGADEIPYEVLKYDCVIEVIHRLFMLCFESNIIPTVWRQAIICPILKDSNSDPRIPLHYRGISLLSTIYKMYSSVLNNRLISYLEDNNLLVDEQNGFRRDRSCADHVFTLNSIVQNRKETFVAFIDLQKAFDTVDRNLLRFSLLSNGIDGDFYNAIKSIYGNTSSCVKINDLHTDWFQTTAGVRQGDNLSPTLFALFINDLAKEIKEMNNGIEIGNMNLSILLYADDIALLADSTENMQKILDTVSKWCRKWRLCINMKKSAVVHFRKKGPRNEFKFRLQGNVLQYSSDYKYLGVIFNEKLNFQNNANTLAKAGGRALGGMISKIHSYKDIGISTFEKLFLNCVAPVLDYCSEVWGLRNYHCIEMVQNRALRYYLGVHRFTPLHALHGEFGWKLPYHRHNINAIRYWNRLVIMDDDRITKQVFNWDFCQCNNHNWSSQIKLLFDSLDFEHIYRDLLVCDITEFENRLLIKFENGWLEKIKELPKLRLYKEIKRNFSTENYIKMNIPKYHRSILAQFRCGILPIRIETGRYRGEAWDERLCIFCSSDEIEDECHFLLNCTQYSNLRSELYTCIGCNPTLSMSSLECINFLLYNFPRQTSKYLYSAYMYRQSLLYSKRHV